MKGETGFAGVLIIIIIISIAITYSVFYYASHTEQAQKCLNVNGIFGKPYTVIELKEWSCEDIEVCINYGYTNTNEMHSFKEVYMKRCYV